MNKLLLALLILIFLFNNTKVFAHPGRTASDGCHYCRTNCDSWGVPWNQRHCHGRTTIIQATSTPAPTLTPVSTLTSTPIPTATLTLMPEVKGESVSPTDIPVQIESETKESNPAAGLISLGALGAGGYWLIRKLQRKFKKEDPESPQES